MLLSVTTGTPCPGGLQTVDDPTVRHCSVDLSTDQAVLIPTNQSGDAQSSIAKPSSGRLPCCDGHDGSTSPHLIRATLHLRHNAPLIYVLIDTGCLQTNMISAKIAALLAKDGGQTYDTNIVLTSGVGGQSYKVQGIMNLTITFTVDDKEELMRHLCLRAIVCREVTIDLIICFLFMYYNLLPLLHKNLHENKVTCCEILSPNDDYTSPVAHIFITRT